MLSYTQLFCEHFQKTAKSRRCSPLVGKKNILQKHFDGYRFREAGYRIQNSDRGLTKATYADKMYRHGAVRHGAV